MVKITDNQLISYLQKIHGDAQCALEYNDDYELLISIMLSAQTTDKSVNKVTPILFEKYPNIQTMSKANIQDVENIIHSIGLYRNKAKNIINAMKELNDKGKDEIPSDFNSLIALPGVGRKTANVFLAEFYGMNTLGVDTHILRISKRIGIASETDGPLEAEIKLKKLIENFPARDFHHMMISFGRTECTAINPKCHDCEIKKYCKYGHNL